MAKTIGNVIKIVAAKIEIGVSASGTEPGSYTEVGFYGEKTLEYKLSEVNVREGGGSNLQKAYDGHVSVPALEVLNAATLETSFLNANVWLKVTPAGTPSSTNPIVRFLNFYCNMEVSGDLSAKGTSLLTITGDKYVTNQNSFITFAAS